MMILLLRLLLLLLLLLTLNWWAEAVNACQGSDMTKVVVNNNNKRVSCQHAST